MTTSAAITPARTSWHLPLAVGVAVFLMVYGSELGQFTLSIDEEAASFPLLPFETAWLRQGRWGMALLTLLLPAFEAIPLLSTLLFGAGLLYAAIRALHDFRLEGVRASLFVGVLVGFPLWPHIAEFNTLAGGFGFGIAAAAYGAGLATRARTLSEHALAIAAMAFAISIYQSLAVFLVVYAGLALHAVHAQRLRAGDPLWAAAPLRAAVTAAGGIAAAALAYWLVQRAALAVSGESMGYIDIYWQAGRLRAAPGDTLQHAAHSLAAWGSGQHVAYLGEGARLLLPVWLGLLPWCLFAPQQRNPGARLALFWATLAATLVVVLLPFALSAGSLPARAHIAVPLIAAWLASRIAWPTHWPARSLPWVLLGYFAVCAASVGASLFHADRYARTADAMLSQDLIARALRAAPADGSEIPFTLVGRTAHPTGGAIRRVEVFGSSFYEHDQGNVCRIWLYWRTLGQQRFAPVVLGARPDLVSAAAAMPSWPAGGAVRLVNGVVVVKLSEATPPQLQPATCIP